MVFSIGLFGNIRAGAKKVATPQRPIFSEISRNRFMKPTWVQRKATIFGGSYIVWVWLQPHRPLRSRWMRIWEKRTKRIDQTFYKFMTIFGPKNPTFLHGPFRELGTNWLFQVTTTAIGVLFQPSDYSRLPTWSNRKSLNFWFKFIKIYGCFGPPKKCLNCIIRVHGKKDPHKEVRRPILYRILRIS